MKKRPGFLFLAACLAASSAAFAQNAPASPQGALQFPDSHAVFYEVKAGDNLTTIAKKHQVTVGLIQKANGLTGDRLSVGQKLKVPNFKFSLWIDKSDNTLTLKGDQEILKTYVVATGTNGSTPVGTFKITNKLENPTWYKAGAVIPPGSTDNQLGTRWMGLDLKGYGIHGTLEPEKLGQQVTAGCIRMRNEEVEELYGLIPPGTEVTITE